MTEAQLAALPVSVLAAADAVLLLWATWPQLPVALRLVEAWGFAYVTGFPWIKLQGNPKQRLDGTLTVKPVYGTGYWVRGCSEIVLICKRGNVAAPRSSVLGLLSDQMEHSRKPENLYEYAESFPGPYLEMFARRPRPGWDTFGNEITGGIEIAVVPS
jgi:N6-adenosine-specific RNA methylase IME4